MLFTCSKYPRYRVLVNGRYLEFKNGEFETEDLEEVAALKAVSDVSFEEVKAVEEVKDVQEVKAVEEVDKKPKK